jgi:hypothetical protein
MRAVRDAGNGRTRCGLDPETRHTFLPGGGGTAQRAALRAHFRSKSHNVDKLSWKAANRLEKRRPSGQSYDGPLRIANSARKLSDAGSGAGPGVCVAAVPSEGNAGACTDRSRCSMSQRASRAQALSSIHWSSKRPMSLRRFAA